MSCNLNTGRSGHRRTARSEANIEAVRNAIEEANEEGIPGGMHITCRRNGLGLSSATFNCITCLDLRFHPYQTIKRHQLIPSDYPRRAQFCQWLLEQDGIQEFCPRREQLLNFQYLRNDDWHKLTVWAGLMGNGTVISPLTAMITCD